MDGRAGLTDQNNSCVSIGEDPCSSVLFSSAYRAMIPPTPPQSPGSSSAWHDVCTPQGRPSLDANAGPSSSWNDACETCSWDETACAWEATCPRCPGLQ
ncbi:rCG47802 [Rattus norvegicus]|uniref:RCG47802 n=1 Tax=Rattus norvegicus TaxID=10116 RepID=A6HWX6_RAT|nr:rCG47802 [Rattus norvegicus]